MTPPTHRDAESVHHDKARSFLHACMTGSEAFYLAWPTVMGYLRIATHPAVFDRPLAPQEAMANVEVLLSAPHVRMVAEDTSFWTIYCETIEGIPTRGNAVPDAHLAALLRQHGINKLYTHDRDFRKFASLDVKDPLS
jgi:toxin-antitoxin system PIN domain toxin